MRQFARHAAWIGAFAFAASLSVHGAGVVGLESLEPPPPPHARPPRTSALDFIEMEPLEEPPTDPTPDPTEPPETPDTPELVAELTPDETSDATPAPTRTRVPPMPAPRIVPIVVPPPPPPPPPEETTPIEVEPINRQSIVQSSDDPSVPPPEDAQYLAEQNRRVEQETQAADSRLESDSPEATPPPESDSIVESSDDGSDTTPTQESPTEAGDAREAIESEVAETNPTPSAESRVATTPRVSTQAEGHTDEAHFGARTSGSSGSGGTPAEELEAVTVDDGFGTFTVMRPRRAATGGSPGESGPRGEGGSSRGHAGAGPNLRVGFSTFEGIYGREQLEEERATRREAREALAAASGNRRQQRWDQFRFAADNVLPTVVTGNQTALNAAASPFAAWIGAVHQRIHAQFVDRFIARIQRRGGELANLELFAQLEIVVDARGRVLRVAITHTSGSSAFDLGAFSSVMDAQPFPSPPEVIMSGDGNVYTLWGFARNTSYCHSSQAAPFILPNPPPLVPMPGVTVDPTEAAQARRRHMSPELLPDDAPPAEELAPRNHDGPDADSHRHDVP